MGAGYSKRSLVDKLGIKPGYRVVIINPPAGYADILGRLPDAVAIAYNLTEKVEFIHCFATSYRDLRAEFENLKAHMLPSGMLWISWPKQSSKVPTDLDENIIRGIGLEYGLVDVKVCAVDQVWSGLKFVFRLKDR